MVASDYSSARVRTSLAPVAAPVVRVTTKTLTQSLARSGVQAALLPPTNEPWYDELANAVEQRRFRIPRTELAGADISDIATWMQQCLPVGAVSDAIRDSLISDVCDLVHMLESVTGTRTYKLRIFTEPPTQRCGYHVDTVPPGEPAWGLLRVYNGEGTRWVGPDAVRSMNHFYGWLERRDRAVRNASEAGSNDTTALNELDTCPDFLLPSAIVGTIAAGTTVVVRHLHADRHWSDHPPDQAWIHCSPTHGAARLVVNLSPDLPLRYQPTY